MVHVGKLTINFKAKTGVKQGYILPPFLFLFGTDWLMKIVTDRKRSGRKWTFLGVLDTARRS